MQGVYNYTYISWSGTAGPVDCFNRVFEEYIPIFIGRVQTSVLLVQQFILVFTLVLVQA